jgi:hypothetical protein
MQLLSFAKIKYGLNNRALEVIYKGAIIPIISYAIPVWLPELKRLDIIKPLENIQRLIALRLCRAFKTVSTDALNVISNLMPIDLVLKQRAIEYYIKHEIQAEACYEYFGEVNIDLNNVQKPFPFYKLPHPASTKVLDIKLEQIESLPNCHFHIYFHILL